MRATRCWTAHALRLTFALALASAVAAQTLPRLPKDYAFPQAADSPGRVTFSHATHVDAARPACASCHPKLFKMLTPGTPADGRPIRHVRMEQGGQCGACHDGRKAFAFDADCTLCHREGAGVAVGGRADGAGLGVPTTRCDVQEAERN